jgi:hypothetical protein
VKPDLNASIRRSARHRKIPVKGPGLTRQ